MSSFMKSSGGGGAAVCALRGGADGLECKSHRKMAHKIKKAFLAPFDLHGDHFIFWTCKIIINQQE